jgi:hypothetical protein
MTEDEDAIIDALAVAIERYLDQRPEASDTVDGIRQWWLPDHRDHATRCRVQAALDRLVRRGVVRVFRTVGGGVVYGRTPSAGRER